MGLVLPAEALQKCFISRIVQRSNKSFFGGQIPTRIFCYSRSRSLKLVLLLLNPKAHFTVVLFPKHISADSEVEKLLQGAAEKTFLSCFLLISNLMILFSDLEGE